jgi:hypothetical protein
MTGDAHLARMHAIWGGVAAATLFAIGNAIWAIGMPTAGARVSEILAFYEQRSTRIVVGGSLSLLALAVFLWFAAAVRQVLNARGSADFLTTAAFGGAVVTTALGCAAESLNMTAAFRAGDGQLGADLAQVLFEVTQDFGSVQSGLGLALFATGIAAASLRTGALARWRCYLLLGAAIVLLTPLGRLNIVPGILLIVIALTVAIGVLRQPARS